jgi:DNA-binding transcriptional LysR family regulator
LATEPLNFVCRSDHRLAKRHTLTVADLACEEFVGAPAGTLGADNLERIFDVAGSSPTVSFEVNDIDTLLDFVANGLGVTLVQETIARSRPELCAIPLLDPGLRWTLAVVTSSRERVAPAARAFIEMLQSDQA